ncbi:MAG: 2-amino-4-hydroxy-6-hydroxymethyldihydropteridine diphosphokinase [Bacteroidales bacterium]
MTIHTTYIIAGSNIAPRITFIKSAAKIILAQGLEISHASSYYESSPWGFQSGTNFLNRVFEIKTTLQPHALLKSILETEKKLGRKKHHKPGYHSRSIDLDILFYDELIIDDHDLTLPHPKIAERKFVLEPLHEIIPQFIHPVKQKSIASLLAQCKDTTRVEKISGISAKK